jgi:hypothetical protein
LQVLDRDDRQFMREHAAGALARRGPEFLRARKALWVQWLCGGAIGLAGIGLLHWSSREAALLLLVTFWLGWIEDLIIARLRADGLAIGLQHAADDLRVWQFVALLRGRRKQPPDPAGHPPVALGLIVDAVAGITASVLVISGMQPVNLDAWSATSTLGLALAVALSIASGTWPSLRARLVRGKDGSTPLPAFAVGQRGIGLLVLAFGLMAVQGGALAPVVLVASAWVFRIVMAAIELIWGMPLLRADARWIETRLRQED